MQQLVEWIDRHWTITWLSCCAVGITVLLLLYYGVGVHAAPAAKQLEVGCEVVGTVGTVIVAHCVDQNDNEFEANSAGMLLSAGN